MDRRDFLASVLATASVAPLSAKSASTQSKHIGPDQTPGNSTDNPRIREDFNARWLFARQKKGTGALGSFDRRCEGADQVEPRFQNATFPDYDDSEWETINLPHTWNAHDGMDESPGYWRGIGWYRKHFRLPARYAPKRVFLEFEGANSVSEFWLNGRRIGGHNGGYTSFEFDVTKETHFGDRENVLTAKIDNLFHATIPPTVKTDYTFYGGIYRDVWLRLSEPIYLSEIAWTTPSVSDGSAEISICSHIVNRKNQDCDLILNHEITDPQGRVAQTFSLKAKVKANSSAGVTEAHGSISSPQLWSPEFPNLYRIRTTLRDESGVVDVIESPAGFRWFRFDPQKGFFLNGNRVQLRGTNWHQSYPGMGNALPNSRHVKDMEMILEMGANFWRTSHYPHDPATLEASDRLGLMVWEELPINKEIGDPAEYTANVLNMADEMIRRDRNHPSIILWGIAGEINAPLSISKSVVGAVANRYRALDPMRPVVMHSPRSDEIEALVDVVGLDVSKDTDEKHRKYPNRVYLVGEYAVATMGRGIFGMGPESEDLACEKHEDYLRQLNERPWMAGGAIWHQFDYEGETYDTVIPHVVAFGMADIWRLPKDVYFFYQSQWTLKPMVHIVGHWTWPGEEGQGKVVRVFSNAEEVELLLNGKSWGVQREAHASGLLHPPRKWQVPYAPGELKVVGRNRGIEVTDTRRTAGAAHHIILESDASQLQSGNPESLAYITAMVADARGTVVPSSHEPITFTLYGPGELLPQAWPGRGTGTTWNVVAGMTRIALRATERTGHAVVSAYSPGLGMGRLELAVTSPGRPDEMEYIERFSVDEP